METNKLAGIFNKWREVIESAETPFSKLVIFLLPILTPIVPSTFSGLHLHQLLVVVFEGKYPVLASVLATIGGVVLELLGYVGAISFIQYIFNWIKTKKEEFLVPSILTLFSYLFYLFAMYQLNVELGRYFGTPVIMNRIIGLLSFITVPSSLLAATNLGYKEMKEEAYQLRQEKREDRLKGKALKQGINVFQQITPSLPDQTDIPSVPKAHKASDYKEYVFELLEITQGQISLTEITAEVNKKKRVSLKHEDVKGTWYKYATQWKRSHENLP